MSHKKPDERRQRHGETPRLAVIPINRSSSAPFAGTAPDRGWLASTVRAWQAFQASPIAPLAQLVDDLALRRLFGLYDARERCWRLFLKAPSAGAALNPLGKFALRMDAQIERLERAFGIGPKARLALGVTFAEVTRSLEDLAQEAQQ